MNKNVSKLKAIINTPCGCQCTSKNFYVRFHKKQKQKSKPDLNQIVYISDAYLEPCHTYIMESFGKIVNGKNFYHRCLTVPKKCQ